jgi:phosphopantothenoylcysteine decarboxylase/phosphopantothenate--cysteine ligase
LQAPENLNFVSVESAQEMFEACLKYYPQTKLAIFAAAVADYTPKVVAEQKIKKKDESLTLELVKTKDIAKEMGKLKQQNQVNVGFALETENEVFNAVAKLESKNFDCVVLNSLRNENTCFGTDFNKISILEHNKRVDFEFKPKSEVAEDIVNYVIEKL